MKHAPSILGALVACAALAAPAAARAQTVAVEDAPAAPARSPSPGPDVHLTAGARGLLISSTGFDPYAGNDLLVQLGVGAGLTVLHAGSVSVLVFAAWDVGTRTASARGEEASLTLHRLGGGIETRWQPARRLFLSAKLAPAALHLRGTIADPSIDRPLVSRTWTWGLDASLGLGLLVAGAGARGTGFWLTGDLGYAFAGRSPMTFAPSPDGTDPRKFGAVMLPPLRPSGPLSRLGVALSF